MKVRLCGLLFAGLGALLFIGLGARSFAAPARASGPPGLHVVGNVLKDGDGRTVRLQGVNIPSLEWSNAGDTQLLRSVHVALDDWHANAIRLPLNQDRWFGKAAGQTDGGRTYRGIVDQVVQAVSERRAYVILDLHWSDAGDWGRHIAQHKMPDLNSVAFWKDAAARYANRPAVLFDLYNEPHDVPWAVWKYGGPVTEKDRRTGQETRYVSPGMQGLLEALRATGAKNAVVAGGLDWAYDLSGVASGYVLRDLDGHGVVYAAHIYPWKRDWDAHVSVIADQYPVLIGEAGCEPDPKQEDPYKWAPELLAYIDAHQFSWTAWCFHPSASPRLLADWDYTPTPYWGAFVKSALTGAKQTDARKFPPGNGAGR